MIKPAFGVCLLALFISFATAQDAEVEKLLARMREVYSSTKTAKITVKTTGLRFGKNAITTEILYMRERKIRAKLSGPANVGGRPRLFISDGTKVSMDDLSGNVQHSRFDLDSIPIPINLEAMSFWDWKRQLSTGEGANMQESKFKISKGVRWNGRDWLVLGETALGQNVYVDYFIDPKTSLIHRVQVYDLKKEEMRIETVVTKLERNVAIDAGLFKIKTKPTSVPPKKIIF